MSLSDDEESTESSGGGSYDPPSEFRSDITEAAGPGEAAGGLNIGFDTQSFVTEEPGSGAFSFCNVFV